MVVLEDSTLTELSVVADAAGGGATGGAEGGGSAEPDEAAESAGGGCESAGWANAIDEARQLPSTITPDTRARTFIVIS
jgi:hypothetical protein